MRVAGEADRLSRGRLRDCPEADRRCFHRDDGRRGRGMRVGAAWLFAAALSAIMPVSAQSIFKCKGADGRITYSSTPCAGEGARLPITAQGRPASVTANTAPSAAAPPAGGSTPVSDDATAPSPSYRAPSHGGLCASILALDIHYSARNTRAHFFASSDTVRSCRSPQSWRDGGSHIQ